MSTICVSHNRFALQRQPTRIENLRNEHFPSRCYFVTKFSFIHYIINLYVKVSSLCFISEINAYCNKPKEFILFTKSERLFVIRSTKTKVVNISIGATVAESFDSKFLPQFLHV